jgi:uncharacterized protein YbjT (DUF2867 family)
MTKVALVFGSTGLIGGQLVSLLANHEHYDKIKVFGRQKQLQGAENPKIEYHCIDFNDLSHYADLIKGDDLYCCLGTTMKTAGSNAAFRKVDYEMPCKLAEIASINKVQSFAVVSSIGANAASANFYLRTKGEMERDVQKFDFSKILIFRPSLLLGKRKEFRLLERISMFVMSGLQFMMIGVLKKYRPIKASCVARVMVEATGREVDSRIFESVDIAKYSFN